MPGLPLENSEGQSIGFHWEGRLAFTEMMTYTDVRDPVISSFTLAWFEDSGWYEVDWNYKEQLLFGF